MIAILATLALRIVNPHEVPAAATLRCDGLVRQVDVAANGIADIADAPCASVESVMPLSLLDLTDDEWQHALGDGGACGTAPMAVPHFACAAGVATAYVTPVDGATYTWTAEGATITDGAGTHRVRVQLTSTESAKLTCVITKNDCATIAAGVVAVREPLAVKELLVPETANANQPVTITWSYDGGRAPVSQLLTGDAFAEPVTLSASDRSYTFTPRSSGSRTIELRASYASRLTVAPPKRRRAAGGGATASECPSVRISRKMEVRGCGSAEPRITAPVDAAAGSTFDALVDVGDGQKVEWSVENGAIAWASPFGERVGVTAGESGETIVTARVERTPGCFAVASASVAVILPASRCAVPPSATLTLLSHNCDGARVQATFTGTPPFAGQWSDGTEFRTTRNTLTHEFSAAGVYSITDLRDASCFGAHGPPPSLEQLRPRARLDADASCGTARLTATFSGVPPFTGRWWDGETFHTNATQLERTVKAGQAASQQTFSIAALTDAVCTDKSSRSNIVQVDPAPLATLTPALPYCETSKYWPGQATVAITGAKTGPYLVEWTDGWSRIEPFASSVTRTFPLADAPEKHYEIKRVVAGGCEADIPRPLFTILQRYPAYDRYSYAESLVCLGETVTTDIAQLPSAGGKVEWILDGEYGRILSGLGTSQITFDATKASRVTIKVRTTFPDGSCSYTTHGNYYDFQLPQQVTNVKVEPATMRAGGKATLTYQHPGNGIIVYVKVPPEREKDLRGDGKGTSWLTDTVGPRTVPFTVEWWDCRGKHTETVTLTITP